MNRQYPSPEVSAKDPSPFRERVEDILHDIQTFFKYDFGDVLLRGLVGTFFLFILSFLVYGAYLGIRYAPGVVLTVIGVVVGFFVTVTIVGLVMKKFGILF